MGRSGYTDDDDSDYGTLRMYGWQANVRRCIFGRKGQGWGLRGRDATACH